MRDTVKMDPASDLTEFDARQVKIGEVHARLKIPNNLVMEGMSLLKSEIATKIANLGLAVSEATHTIIILGEIIDYAMRLMTSAYVEVGLATRAKTPLSVLMTDIDHFKSINDRYGHSAGDVVLGHSADILLNCVRATDFIFRYGGEEFLIVLVETGHDGALTIAERIRQQIAEKPADVSNGPVSFTMSIGVASFEGHPDYQYLIDAADQALYRAKESGRNRVVSAV